MQIVLVKFRDSTTFDYWATKDEVDKSRCKVGYACGLLFEENKDVVKVALLVSEDQKTFSNWATIPAPAVLSVDVIKEIDWDKGG